MKPIRADFSKVGAQIIVEIWKRFFPAEALESPNTQVSSGLMDKHLYVGDYPNHPSNLSLMKLGG
jgi:hypothetical protein